MLLTPNKFQQMKVCYYIYIYIIMYIYIIYIYIYECVCIICGIDRDY